VRRCVDDHRSPQHTACRPSSACAANLTASQRAILDAELATVIAGLPKRGAQQPDACAGAFVASSRRVVSGEPVSHILFPQAIAPEFRTRFIAHCHDDHWSAEAIRCFAGTAQWRSRAKQLNR
jgi:hypothetical protein